MSLMPSPPALPEPKSSVVPSQDNEPRLSPAEVLIAEPRLAGAENDSSTDDLL